MVKQIEQMAYRECSFSPSLKEKVTWWNPPKGSIRAEKEMLREKTYVHLVLCQENDKWTLFLEAQRLHD